MDRKKILVQRRQRHQYRQQRLRRSWLDAKRAAFVLHRILLAIKLSLTRDPSCPTTAEHINDRMDLAFA